jgi:predicted Zn-dependent protease
LADTEIGRFLTRSLLAAGWVAVLALVGCTINPATGGRQFNLLTETQEIALGKESDPSIVAQYGLYEDDELARYVDDLGKRLAATSERPGLPWTFRVLDDPIVNAFALPGGYIYVTRGILAHLGSEADLVGVLGHEIGHVTARHGASQMSKGLLAQAGLGVVSAIDSPHVNNALGVAQSGIGLLFLKHGRDDERQADRLGVRYALRNEYDPRSLAGVFETLGRVSARASAERMPTWLSTHPSPGNRQELLAAEIAAVEGGLSEGLIVRSESYLCSLDGLVVGEDPREGYFRGSLYIHPEMRFRLRFPAGWEGLNLKQSVRATAPNGEAVLQLQAAEGDTVTAASERFFASSSIERGARQEGPSGKGETVSHTFTVLRPDGNLSGLATFIEHRGTILVIFGYSLGTEFATHVENFQSTSASFVGFRDGESDSARPLRLRLVKLRSAMTIRAWADRHEGSFTVERLALLNNIDLDKMLPAGSILKTVEGRLPGDYPPLVSSQRSASRAALQPLPAAVTACL